MKKHVVKNFYYIILRQPKNHFFNAMISQTKNREMLVISRFEKIVQKNNQVMFVSYT